VIVAAMARGRRELLLGAHRDPQFGPVVVVGDGGRYVEAMPDLGVLMPPFDTGDVRCVLGRLRLAPVLAGTRGEPPLALAGYAEAAVALGAWMAAEPRVASVDVNPFLVGSTEAEGLALDAVVLMHASDPVGEGR